MMDIQFKFPKCSNAEWTAWFNGVFMFLMFLRAFNLELVSEPIMAQSAGDPTCGPARWVRI